MHRKRCSFFVFFFFVLPRLGIGGPAARIFPARYFEFSELRELTAKLERDLISYRIMKLEGK